MLESEFWGLVRTHFPPESHATRIENVATGGIADVTACLGGAERWIELKVVHVGGITMRAAQGPWIKERCRAGGWAYVLVRLTQDSMGLYWGPHVADCPSRPLKANNSSLIKVTDLPDPMFYSKKPFDWSGLMGTLFSQDRPLSRNRRETLV